MKHPVIKTAAIIAFCFVLGIIIYTLITSFSGGGY
jgi:hypothetical protein